MSYDDINLNELGSALGPALIVVALLLIGYIIWAIIGNWKLYVKAGQPGWKAIIPYYSTYTLVNMVGLNWYWFLLTLAPLIVDLLHVDVLSYIGDAVNLFAYIMIYYNMSKKLHKNTGWIVLAIIFEGFIIPMSGYSKTDTWDKDAVVNPNAFFDKKQQ